LIGVAKSQSRRRINPSLAGGIRHLDLSSLDPNSCIDVHGLLCVLYANVASRKPCNVDAQAVAVKPMDLEWLIET